MPQRWIGNWRTTKCITTKGNRPGYRGVKENVMPCESEAEDDQKYQRWMAESLVASMGYDKAIKACRNMCWYGTLAYLVAQKEGQFAHSSHQDPEFTKAA